ncbi:MAG TPA: DMT family transporter, partial [Anaerolineales bacterium]|nr:DMT family transporter [Anaerolineales bacterium]
VSCPANVNVMPLKPLQPLAVETAADVERPPFPPALALFVGIMAVSSAAIFIRFAQREAPSLVIAAYRLSLAAIFLAPLALTRRRQELAAIRGRTLVLALLSGLFLALHFATWITSLEYTSVASSVVLVTTTPLWVALFSPLLLKERVSRWAAAGMGIALLGGVGVGLSDVCTWEAGGLVCPDAADFVMGRAFWGDVLALIGAWMAAAYLMIGRRLRRQMTLVGYIFLVYSMAAVILVGLVLIARQPLVGYSSQTYLWLILLALIPQLLGHTIFNWSLRFISAAYVSVTLLAEPIGSSILAYFILSETPGGIKILVLYLFWLEFISLL